MRIHGRVGVAYLSLNSGDAASPVAFLSDWSISCTLSWFDATVITDTQIVHGCAVTGVGGDFTGFYDTATAQSYAAAVDGLPRNMYLYPSASGAQASQFFSGMVLPDFAIGGGTASAVALKVTWAASGPVTRSSPYGIADSAAGYAATYRAAY